MVLLEREVKRMKKTVVINGKEHTEWNFEKIVYWFCFANLIAQMIILYLNFTTFKNSMVTRAFLGGLQTVVLPLTIILTVVSIHNNRIRHHIAEMLREQLMLLAEEVKNNETEPKKNVKEKKDGRK